MFKTKNESNYLAKMIVLQNPMKHPNADRLQGWMIDGNKVWTDLSQKSGDKVIYFPVECSINFDILSNLNLFEDKTKNINQELKGYINDKGRVRAIRLRNEPSEGLVIPFTEITKVLNILNFKVSEKDFKENLEFDSFNDFVICQKYVPVQTKQKCLNNEPKVKGKKEPKEDITIDGQFALHGSTSHLGKNLHNINLNSIISITEKLHGTSFVVGNVLTKKKLNWFEKLLKRFKLANIQESEYNVIYSSRSIVKNKNRYVKENENDLWTVVKNEVKDKLQNGITIYGEIVGFNTNGSAIQKKYDYSCDPSKNEHKVYVYKITLTNNVGKVFEFTSGQIKEYCLKYDLNYVPEHFYGRAEDFCSDFNEYVKTLNTSVEGFNLDNEWSKFLFDKIKKLYTEKNCTMCKNKVPNEGVVIKVDNLFENKVYKCKSFAFTEQETKLLDSGESDTESEN